MSNTLIIGAGGVGGATAHKCAQHNNLLGDLCVASRTRAKCEAIIEDILRRKNLKDASGSLTTATVDAMDSAAVAGLIERTGSRLVLNAGSPYCNLPIMEACLEAGAHYIDTAVHEVEGAPAEPAPWYANYEWKYRDRFAEKRITGILGAGFDPGAVNVFCAYVQRHLIDAIDSIDIMDVNAGSHGRFFATNFDPETNLHEISEDVLYWEDGDWVRIPCHSRSRTYDFPEVGERRVYSMGHDELHSLPLNIGAHRIEFWMGFDDQYINCFNVLKEIGLLSNRPVEVEGVEMAPIKMVKAVLPEPASLAPDYSGKVCIGCLVKGAEEGRPREVFIYSTCDHAECYRETGSQAISYTTAVPLVTTALLVTQGAWDVGRLVNLEELDPDPFMRLMPQLGLSWDVREQEQARARYSSSRGR